MEIEKTYLIKESLAQAVLNYLGSRPYREVAPLIDALARLVPQPEADPPKEGNG